MSLLDQKLDPGVLTPIVKFLGYDPDRLPGKLIHQKIMGTYSVILKLGT